MIIPPWLPSYGSPDWRGNCPSETVEQVTFFGALARTAPRLAAVAIHPRLEGKRTHWQAAQQRAEGALNKGAPDIIIPGAPTFVCELKRRDRTQSTWQTGQLEYLQACQEAGCFVCVALGYEAALAAVGEWRRRS